MNFRDIRGNIYDAAVKGGMFKLAPERIHGYISQALQIFSHATSLKKAVSSAMVVRDPVLEQKVAGLTFSRPLGLAAGFDKNAEEVDAWGPVGFGFAEVGTVTSVAQPGNPAPRLFRLPEDRALLNRMGFNNQGALAAAQRLEQRQTTIPVGVNIGKSKRCAAELAPNDYRESTAAVADTADYLVINVSSPNTPGLRDLQAVESLRPIIAAVRKLSDKPLFVKIAPDLSDEDIDAVTDLAIEEELTGLIATNTTISREGLKAPQNYVSALGAGGISGAPVAQRAQEVLQRIYDRSQGALVLIGVGGIETPQQAWERIAAGATLLQGYTPFIYGGPDWIRDIHLGLAAQIKAHGFSNIAEAVGCGKPWIA